MKGFLPILQKLRQSKNLSLEDWFEVCVLAVQSSLLAVQTRGNNTRNVAKAKLQHFEQRQIAPTVLSEPWGCSQHCWSCMRSFNATEFAMTVLMAFLCIQQPDSSQNTFYSFPVLLLFFSICLCVVCSCTINSLRHPKLHPARTGDGWGVLLKQSKLRVLCLPPQGTSNLDCLQRNHI